MYIAYKTLPTAPVRSLVNFKRAPDDTAVLAGRVRGFRNFIYF